MLWGKGFRPQARGRECGGNVAGADAAHRSAPARTGPLSGRAQWPPAWSCDALLPADPVFGPTGREIPRPGRPAPRRPQPSPDCRTAGGTVALRCREESTDLRQFVSIPGTLRQAKSDWAGFLDKPLDRLDRHQHHRRAAGVARSRRDPRRADDPRRPGGCGAWCWRAYLDARSLRAAPAPVADPVADRRPGFGPSTPSAPRVP